jgi:hypothetical protein
MVEFAGMTEERYEQLLESSPLERRGASEEIWADLKRVRGVLTEIRRAHYLPLDWPIKEDNPEITDEEYTNRVFHYRERGIACVGDLR